MNYLVMENHKGFSVVIDEAGRILKVANMGYTLGETVTDVTTLQSPKTFAISTRTIQSLVAIAACFALILAGVLNFYTPFTPYADIYLKVNPEVKLTVNEENQVGAIEALNEDATKLLVDYKYKNKSLTLVLDEILDRAIALGMVKEGSEIEVDIDTEDDDWFARTGIAIRENLVDYFSDKVTVTIKIHSVKEESHSAPKQPETPSKDAPTSTTITPKPTPAPVENTQPEIKNDTGAPQQKPPTTPNPPTQNPNTTSSNDDVDDDQRDDVPNDDSPNDDSSNDDSQNDDNQNDDNQNDDSSNDDSSNDDNQNDDSSNDDSSNDDNQNDDSSNDDSSNDDNQNDDRPNDDN